MPRASRPYNSPARARQAEATRRSILGAARRLFADTGYQMTTVDSIAALAEVSAPTVYATFGSKQAILAELVRGAAGEPALRRLGEAAELEPDPEARLRKSAHVMRLALESEAELRDVLWQAGSGNPELLAAWRQMHANRRRRLTEVLAPILSGSDGERFLDLAWAYGSPEMYRLLVQERGWTPAEYEDWLAGALLGLHREL